MASTLLIVQFVLALLITIAILLQKSSSMGFGVYSGSNESLFGAKGPASFLAKITFFLGFIFVVNTIALGYVYSTEKNASVIDSVQESEIPQVPSSAIPAPAAPQAPKAPVSDQK